MANAKGGIGRRRLFKAGVSGAILALFGGGLAFVRTRGYDLPVAVLGKLASLEPWEYVLLTHVARRMVAPDRVGDASIPSADDVDVVGFLDGYLAKMDPETRRDLGRLFAVVEHVAPIASGYVHRFTLLGPGEQDRVLASLEASGQELLRGGFAGLKALCMMGYYRDPRTWKLLGYDGPWVGRPAAGWW